VDGVVLRLKNALASGPTAMVLDQRTLISEASLAGVNSVT